MKDRDLVSIFYIWISSFSAAFFEEAVFSPLCVLGSFVKDQLAIDAWIYVWNFCSDELVFLSVFVPIPCHFHCYGFVV
jgi:hypothetical protein